MLVQHSDDDDYFFARDEVDGVGKAAQQGPSRPLADLGKQPRVLEYAFVERVQLQYKLRAESSTLILVPERGPANVRFRNGTDA